ncbi:SAM-dependent methyltransferase, partial [Rhizobium johnstonii]
MTEQNPQDKAEGAASDVDAVVERVSTAALGMQEMLALYLGDRLGWYRELARGPRSAAELATATDTDERYAREWLEQQA